MRPWILIPAYPVNWDMAEEPDIPDVSASTAWGSTGVGAAVIPKTSADLRSKSGIGILPGSQKLPHYRQQA
jgi:hypothetical protein